MAGKALRKRILTDVAEKGGADYLFDRVASGATVSMLAEEYGCSRAYLSRSLNENPEYAEAMKRARVEAADALVEQGLAMVDKLDGSSSTNDIASTRERVQYRKFMAGSFNQERYGNRPQTNVNISIGDLHLDALRKVNSELKALHDEDAARDAAIEGDYEVNDDDGGA